ncbi:MAG: hypothetical protein ABJ051_11790 [Lentilitoribacter sp.]|uniref:hypothetical protein n=1 Tax=Sphingomonadales TaxID=204457 RepID=UPI0032642377
MEYTRYTILLMGEKKPREILADRMVQSNNWFVFGLNISDGEYSERLRVKQDLVVSIETEVPFG